MAGRRGRSWTGHRVAERHDPAPGAVAGSTSRLGAASMPIAATITLMLVVTGAVAFVATGGLGAGCARNGAAGGQDRAARAPEGPSDRAPAPEPATATEATGEDDALAPIEFTVRGGIAGFDLALGIAADGTVELVERGHRVASDSLGDEARRELAELAAAADPGEEQIAYGDGAGIADGWERTVRVSGGDRSWSVREVTDPDASMPPAMRAFFERLMEITMRLQASRR